jgi:hypothetical protein
LQLKRAIDTMAVNSIVAITRNAILLYITRVYHTILYIFFQ